MKYVVVLPTRPPGGVEVAGRAMAEAFGIPQSKAEGLLRRAPGPLTKGIDEREAVRVAYRLRKLGLAVEVRPVDAEPATAPVGRAARTTGSSGARGPDASSQDEPATRSSAVRSPFLSQVDEAPPPIPGLQDRPPSAPSDRRHRDRRRGRSRGETPADDTPFPSSGTAPTATPPAVDSTADAPRADAPRAALSRPETQPRSGPAATAEPTRPPEPAADDATPAVGTDRDGTATATGSGTSRQPDTYRTGARSGVRPALPVVEPSGVRSPFARHLLLAAVVPGLLAFAALVVTWLAMPEPSFAIALAVGMSVLAIAAASIGLAGRPLLREHDRVLAETVRISRGNLARPVQASDRYPEAVQALERIRVSLQEGLDRLRRRKPAG